ncbi:adenine phosphoribosyltransferase [Notoacmeibacter sp. MSK16QG-6]|uniref:adenine phosphoribosyltransferase n=1 Tax=Notoacmeibacter sp. MSK16QG-6 TaxID=2957982 RepID=UPI0020A14CBA|nr:adenine phosphoribosyltransferase [Notoacmeibacter sp. MSK16QG-6]MCP1199879.1 adenine phosphoribosyltransferase [Notoacmeibacter sp. MSK16QG-6]
MPSTIADPALAERLRAAIRTIPDYPKPGILFRDITTLLSNGPAFRDAVNAIAERFADERIDSVAGIEARGFVLGGAVAHAMGVGFVPIRKSGKLPHRTISREYALEYGTDRLEVHVDALPENARVLVIDDLIATGGTALAGVELVEELGGHVVAAAFIIDLPDLGGAERLAARGVHVEILLSFDGH